MSQIKLLAQLKPLSIIHSVEEKTFGYLVMVKFYNPNNDTLHIDSPVGFNNEKLDSLIWYFSTNSRKTSRIFPFYTDIYHSHQREGKEYIFKVKNEGVKIPPKTSIQMSICFSKKSIKSGDNVLLFRYFFYCDEDKIDYFDKVVRFEII